MSLKLKVKSLKFLTLKHCKNKVLSFVKITSVSIVCHK